MIVNDLLAGRYLPISRPIVPIFVGPARGPRSTTSTGAIAANFFEAFARVGTGSFYANTRVGVRFTDKLHLQIWFRVWPNREFCNRAWKLLRNEFSLQFSRCFCIWWCVTLKFNFHFSWESMCFCLIHDFSNFTYFNVYIYIFLIIKISILFNRFILTLDFF